MKSWRCREGMRSSFSWSKTWAVMLSPLPRSSSIMLRTQFSWQIHCPCWFISMFVKASIGYLARKSLWEKDLLLLKLRSLTKSMNTQRISAAPSALSLCTNVFSLLWSFCRLIRKAYSHSSMGMKYTKTWLKSR